MREINVFWFRRDLRLRDNTGLFKALSSGLPVLPIFIFDSNILDQLASRSDARVQFIFDEIQNLNKELEPFETSVQMFHGRPDLVFQKLLDQYSVREVFANEDYEPYGIKRDQTLAKILRAKQVGLNLSKDHVIFSPRENLKADETPYLVFTPFSKSWKNKLKEEHLKIHKSEDLLKNFIAKKPLEIRSLREIGFQNSNIIFPKKIILKSVLKNYESSRNFPALEDGTSRLGAHLRFGTLSIRRAVKLAKEHSQVWLSELIWRKFFISILFHFPHTTAQSFRNKYSAIPWRKDPEDFRRWSEAQTGYPIVDAGMRELVETGHMHNRVRMITASFLTKHLLLPWTWGERFFAQHLLDFELASNVGNWQWSAGCGVDAAPYFRIFNPQAQQKKFDPDGVYVKKWLPEMNSKSNWDPMIDHEYARRRALKTFKDHLREK